MSVVAIKLDPDQRCVGPIIRFDRRCAVGHHDLEWPQTSMHLPQPQVEESRRASGGGTDSPWGTAAVAPPPASYDDFQPIAIADRRVAHRFILRITRITVTRTYFTFCETPTNPVTSPPRSRTRNTIGALSPPRRPPRPPQFAVDLLEETLFRLKWAVKGLARRRRRAERCALDSPFQSEFLPSRDRRRIAAASPRGRPIGKTPSIR